jgi:hypothetical protein
MPYTLFEHNPLLRKPLMAVLTVTQEQAGAERKDIEVFAATRDPEAFLRQSPSTIVDALLRNGALEERLLINKEPYGGSLADAQTDERLTDDAQIERRVFLTGTGKQMLDEYSPRARLQALLDSNPEHSRVFRKILALCLDDSKGQSRADLEQALMEDPLLQPNSLGVVAIYPQYFLDALESVGGIVWRDSWHTTEAGKVVVTQPQSQPGCSSQTG